MDWTKAQEQTIETRGKNILVSAAAGSGKTTVLVERIKRLIINDKVGIDNFLITTFTNAAAAEMKERLEKALNEEMKKTGSDKVFLKKQLRLLPSANISTFHIFALEVMRSFFHLTELEPGFRIGDEIEVSIIKQEAINELFEKRFEEDYDNFSNFLKKYSKERNERTIKENLINLYKQMRSIPDYFKWARERTELLNSKSPIKELGIMDSINEECLTELCRAISFYERAAEILHDAGLTKLYGKAQQDVLRLYEAKEPVAAEGLKEFDKFSKSLKVNKLNQMRATDEEKEEYELLQKQVGDLRKKGKACIDGIAKKYLARAIEDYDEEIRAGYGDTVYIVGLIEELEEIYKAKKQEKNMVDFDDVMHYAIDILRDDMAAAEYRNRFKYIFIDEFQDSNMLQEAIIGRITGPDNLFMVGDVKQSIYKFRLAEPEIFKAKYEQYSREEEKQSIKIDLNDNFRSKRSVTELVNAVFRDAMDGYNENAELKCTIEETSGITPQLNLIVKSKDADKPFDDYQMEAEHVVHLVKENLGSEIFDTKKKIFRPVEYRDIAILSRSKAIIGEIEKALNNSGIPAYGGDSGEFFDTVEIQVFVNLLKVIDNSHRDIPMISVMRCPVFGFTMKELASIRIFAPDGPYHQAVITYGEDGPDGKLRNKIAGLLAQIDYWKELKNTVSLEELVKTLLYDTGYYDYCSGLPVGKQRVSNLILLLEKACSFEKSNYSGLYGFLSYVENMKKSNDQMAEAKVIEESANVVQIMTVHGSKGLEFPVVILVNAGATISNNGIGSPASLHKDLSIALPVVNKEEKWHRKTFLQNVIASRKAAEEYEEEVRILYVAMTRAMDRFVATAVVGDVEKLEEDSGKAKSFAEMIYKPLKLVGGKCRIYNDHELVPETTASDSPIERIAGLFARSRMISSDDRPEIIDRVLAYEYPYRQLDKVKSKYSVTELNNRQGEMHNNDLTHPEFAREKNALSAADIGTVMHLVMERIDFELALEKGSRYVRDKADELVSSGELSEEERAAIDVENVAAFFNDPIGRRAVRSLRLEKEREFILQKEVDGADAIVQGIIDCYFEEADGLVLVDYKNSFMGGNISEEDIADRYRGQIELYIEALEGAEEMPVKEAYLYLFELQKFISITK